MPQYLPNQHGLTIDYEIDYGDGWYWEQEMTEKHYYPEAEEEATSGTTTEEDE